MELNFDNTFDISSYGGKLFKADPIKIGTTWQIPGVQAATPEGKEIQKLVQDVWSKEMESFKKTKEKEYKDILAHTEKAVYTSAQKKAMEFQKDKDPIKVAAAYLTKEAEGANVMIKNAITTFQGLAAKKMDELWTKIAEKIDKKFKTKLKNEKIKAGFKIAGLVILVIAGAALAIAGAILTGLAAPTGIGALAGVGIAIGGVATIAGAISKIVAIYSAAWPDHKTASKTLRTKAEALKDALTYEEDKAAKSSDGSKLGPKEKLKLFFGNTKGKRAEMATAIKSMSVWNAKMMQSIEKHGQAEIMIEKKLQELEKKLDAEKDKDSKMAKEIKQQADACVKRLFEGRAHIENVRRYLKRYSAALDEGNVLVATESKFDSKALAGFLGKLAQIAETKEMDTLITFGKGTADFLKGLIKFVG